MPAWSIVTSSDSSRRVPAWVVGLSNAVATVTGSATTICLHGKTNPPGLLTQLSWRVDALLFGACPGLALDRMDEAASVPQDLRVALVRLNASDLVEVIELTVGGHPACELVEAIDEAARCGRGEIDIQGVRKRSGVVTEQVRWHVYLDERSRHRACENVVFKLVKLVVGMVRDNAVNLPDAGEAPRLPMHGVKERLGPLGRSFRHAIRRLGWHDQWAITVYRNLADEALWPKDRGIDLIPPKECFWADPFLFRKDGLLWVFFEELPFATERGHISVLSIDSHGHVSQPKVVLKQPWHLSYPNVFEHEGNIYMVPESGSEENVVLYRAKAFPGEWEPVAELLTGIRSADATFFRQDGAWWLMCAVASQEESIYDQLAVFRADALHGPYQAVSALPVVVDTAVARPAGPVFRWNGQTVRPAQDCRRRYGRGLQLLSMSIGPGQAFVQQPIASVEGTASGAMGVHTYCRLGSDLAVDWYRWVPKWGGRTRSSAGMLALHEYASDRSNRDS